MKTEIKIFPSIVKQFDDSNLIVEHFISTEKPDRVGDIVRADGMRISGKPVVLFGHGYGPIGNEPIAKPLEVRKGEFNGNPGLIARTQFYDGSHLTPPDNTGQRLYEKVKNGFLPNWSIGFIPLKYQEIETNGKRGREILEWELLEYSLVAVPANPDAQTLDFSSEIKALELLKFRVSLLPDLDDLLEMDEVNYEENNLLDSESKPYPGEHACRLEDPEKYEKFRRQNNKFGDGIHAIWGILKGGKVELQAIRFSKDKFTPSQAQKWLKENGFECKEFEPAEREKMIDDEVFNDINSMEMKKILPYRKTPLDPEESEWDANKEVADATVDDLKIMCAWYDEEKPDVKSSYKLPHHRASGNHNCVWRAVAASAAAIMGARGGVKIPLADLPGVKAHIGKHYEDFDKGPPPWEKEWGIFLDSITDEDQKAKLAKMLWQIFEEEVIEPQSQKNDREDESLSSSWFKEWESLAAKVSALELEIFSIKEEIGIISKKMNALNINTPQDDGGLGADSEYDSEFAKGVADDSSLLNHSDDHDMDSGNDSESTVIIRAQEEERINLDPEQIHALIQSVLSRSEGMLRAEIRRMMGKVD